MLCCCFFLILFRVVKQCVSVYTHCSLVLLSSFFFSLSPLSFPFLFLLASLEKKKKCSEAEFQTLTGTLNAPVI